LAFGKKKDYPLTYRVNVRHPYKRRNGSRSAEWVSSSRRLRQIKLSTAARWANSRDVYTLEGTR